MATNLAVQAYDTLSIAKNLEEDYSFDKKQAEGIARAIHDHLVANVATKEDLRNLGIELRSEMAELRSELRSEIAELRSEITGLRSETRGEIAELRSEITGLRSELRGEIAELRSEIANINNRIDNLSKSLTIRMGAMIVAGVGFLAALQTIIA